LLPAFLHVPAFLLPAFLHLPAFLFPSFLQVPAVSFPDFPYAHCGAVTRAPRQSTVPRDTGANEKNYRWNRNLR